MKLLRFNRGNLEPTELETSRLRLRTPLAEHYGAWADIRERSASFLQPFEPTWASDELSRAAFRARLRRQQANLNSGRGISWFLVDLADEKKLLGGITLSHIRRGVADTAVMGYWMGEDYAGKGYMKEAVLAVTNWAFEQHGLHRVEAATVPENSRSQRLLLSCGFSQEGVARQYLKINGQWRDHILFAKLASD